MSYTILKQILLSRLSVDYLDSKEIGAFEEHFQCVLSEVTKTWVNRESTFQFLESAACPHDVDLALELLTMMRRSDELLHEIEALNRERSVEGKASIELRTLVYATTLEELTFIEELFDDQILDQISTLLNKKQSYVVREVLTMIHSHFNRFAKEYIEQIISQEVKNVQSAWLAYPCVSRHINKWAGHFELSSIDFNEQDHPLMERLLDRIHKDWADLWCIHTWKSKVVWTNGVNESDQAIWTELFEPFIKDFASKKLKNLRDRDLITDLKNCFVTLIDAKRPKDQRIGSFWIDENQNSHITVIFLTRDGKLLAQRDLHWDPQNPLSILKAFETINIRILAYPKGQELKFPKTFELLASKYQLHGVSSVVLDPVPHPQSLSILAQKTLRIGQRFVAPLRFWARTDLVELMKCFVNPQIIDILDQSNALDELRLTLEDACSKRWLLLRKKRKVRQSSHRYIQTNQSVASYANLDEIQDHKVVSTAHSKKSDLSHFSRGDEVDVTVLHKNGYHITVQVIGHDKIGKLKIQRKDIVDVGQTIKVYVLGENPKSKVLTLSLNSQTQSRSMHSHRKGLRSDQDSTITRLNKLFSVSGENETNPGNKKNKQA